VFSGSIRLSGKKKVADHEAPEKEKGSTVVIENGH